MHFHYILHSLTWLQIFLKLSSSSSAIQYPHALREAFFKYGHRATNSLSQAISLLHTTKKSQTIVDTVQSYYGSIQEDNSNFFINFGEKKLTLTSAYISYVTHSNTRARPIYLSHSLRLFST